MIRKFLSKYILEVIPSIVATVVGAYIVTHYINSKPEAERPKASVSATAPQSVEKGRDAKPEPVAEPVDANDGSSVKTSRPDPKPASEKKPPVTEAVAAPIEPRRAPTATREKSAAKPAAQPAQSAAVDPMSRADDTRDANEIARAAIERVRGAEPRTFDKPRQVEPARVPEISQEAARAERDRPGPLVYAPVTQQVPAQPSAVVRTIPPMMTVVPVPSETTVGAVPPQRPEPLARVEDSSRPTPPAEIPPRPLDLRAKERTSVAEDVVSTAKSVFHAVIPGTN